MAPFLLPGDGVTLVAVPPRSLRAGDIVALAAQPRPIVHRLVAARGRRGQRPLRTKGDAAATYDRPLPSQTVLGRVVSVQRGGRVLSLATRRSRFGALLLAWISCRIASAAHLPSPLLRRATRSLLRQAMRITAAVIWLTYR